MDDLQQRIVEIALSIPGYVGYQAKEQRRDADKLVRRQLAGKYDELRTRLERLQQKAPLDYVVNLEQLDQKLLRLIALFNTSVRGYAGWFDSGQIVEGDLDQLTQFDQALSAGVSELQTNLDQIANALKSQTGVDDTVSACADTLDALNAQFNQREEFLAMGKKPSPLTVPAKPRSSPLQVLESQPAPPPQELATLATLKLKDAVSYGDADYVVAGKIVYTISAGSFWAFLLQDREQKRWLRVGPKGELSICQEITFSVTSPLPETLSYDNQPFTRGDNGTAGVVVEGASGQKRGSVTYARYASNAGSRLWIEDYGTETRVMTGQVIEVSDLKVYKRS